MTSRTKKTSIATSLPEDELAELDRVRELQHLTRAEVVREAIRWYVGVMRQLPAAEEPTPDEAEAIRLGEEEFARGGGRRLDDILHALGRSTQ